MPVDRRSAERFFERKLAGAHRIDGKRHPGYRIQTAKGTVLLPVLTISRGASGEDLSDRNAKGLADDLGLSLDGFLEACECRLSIDVVTFCAAVRVTVSCHEQHQLDGISFNADIIESVSRAVGAWLKIVPARKNSKLTTREVKELQRARARLPAPATVSPVNKLIAVIHAYAVARRFPN
jgi:hypothetical protein